MMARSEVKDYAPQTSRGLHPCIMASIAGASIVLLGYSSFTVFSRYTVLKEDFNGFIGPLLTLTIFATLLLLRNLALRYFYHTAEKSIDFDDSELCSATVASETESRQAQQPRQRGSRASSAKTARTRSVKSNEEGEISDSSNVSFLVSRSIAGMLRANSVVTVDQDAASTVSSISSATMTTGIGSIRSMDSSVSGDLRVASQALNSFIFSIMEKSSNALKVSSSPSSMRGGDLGGDPTLPHYAVDGVYTRNSNSSMLTFGTPIRSNTIFRAGSNQCKQ